MQKQIKHHVAFAVKSAQVEMFQICVVYKLPNMMCSNDKIQMFTQNNDLEECRYV